MVCVCKTCVFGVSFLCNKDHLLLLCTNNPQQPGRFTQTEPNLTCPNHRPAPVPAVRLEPPPPENDEIRYISLTKGRFAIVDKSRYDWLNQYRWCAHISKQGCYAVRHARKDDVGRKGMIWMHKEIVGCAEEQLVDHWNNNPLDNRITNLRPATHSENMYNRRKTSSKTYSRFIGVTFDRVNRKWCAQIVHNGKKLWLGRFKNELDAARAYDDAAKKYHSDFAKLNFS